jgi:hypothetical protein
MCLFSVRIFLIAGFYQLRLNFCGAIVALGQAVTLADKRASLPLILVLIGGSMFGDNLP